MAKTIYFKHVIIQVAKMRALFKQIINFGKNIKQKITLAQIEQINVKMYQQKVYTY